MFFNSNGFILQASVSILKDKKNICLAVGSFIAVEPWDLIYEFAYTKKIINIKGLDWLLFKFDLQIGIYSP